MNYDGYNYKNTTYIEDLVYNINRELQYMLTQEGRIIPTDNGDVRYEYFLKDHLGNIRVSFADMNNDGTADLLQEDHYYPYGMRLSGLSYVGSGTPQNKYLYNGKELQDDKFGDEGIDWYDYGWRMYDPALGRWHVIDPKAEDYFDFSPYHMAGNNPIIFLDIDGMGYYYTSSGTFLGDDGINDDYIYTTNKSVIDKNTNKEGEINWSKIKESQNTETLGCFEEFVNMNDYEISSTELKQNLVGLTINMESTGLTEDYEQITVVSGDRNIKRNKQAGGSRGSMHTKGKAADIKVEGMSNETLAKAAADFGAFGGVIFYPNWGDTKGFGTYNKTTKDRSTYGLSGKTIRYKLKTITLKNKQTLAPHVHIDMRSYKYLGRYAGNNTKRNVYLPWVSKKQIR